jgi:hypothetical protein
MMTNLHIFFVVVGQDFMLPLTQQAVIGEKERALLFANVQVILDINRELLRLLEERRAGWHRKQQIGDIFLQIVSNRFQTYMIIICS